MREITQQLWVTVLENPGGVHAVQASGGDPAMRSQNSCYFLSILVSLVVRISACHVEGPGSIPGRGEIFLK
jgi:hypothetical protein